MASIKKIFSILKEAVHRSNRHEIIRLAAALAYYTAFSLAPLLLMVIAVAGLALGPEAAQGHIFYQIEGLVGRDSAAAIQSMLLSVWKPSTNFGVMTVSFIGILIGATGVLSELKASLDKIWQVKDDESLIHLLKQRAKYLGMILGIGFLLLVSLILSAAIAALGKFLSGYLPFPEVFMHIVDWLLSICVVSGLFALIFKYIPKSHLSWRPIGVGALFTGVLFTLGKFILGLYSGKGAVGSSYGTAGSIMIILMWVYYSGAILYFGAEFTRVYAEETRSIPQHPLPAHRVKHGAPA